MPISHAVILGILQGITEFLPVSSSGHLIFFPKLFGWSDQGIMFDVAVHMGTLLAVVFAFRKTLGKIIKSFFVLDRGVAVDLTFGREQNSAPNFHRQLGYFIVLSTIPALLVGAFLGAYIENHLRTPLVVGSSLIGWGIIMGLADLYRSSLPKGGHTMAEMTWRDAIFIGAAQAIALVPGTSRSGITITAGFFARFGKTAAAEFSFLMSVPIIALAGAKEIYSLLHTNIVQADLLVFFVGAVCAAISGFLAIKLFLKILKQFRLWPFVVYRVVVGSLILWWL